MENILKNIKTERTQLFNGDCFKLLKKLPDTCVQAFISDIPYGIDYNPNFRVVSEARKIANDKDLTFLPDTLEEAYRILSDNGHIAICCGEQKIDEVIRDMKAVFNYQGLLIWHKTNTTNDANARGLVRNTEFIVTGSKSKEAFYYGGRVLSYCRTRNKKHFTEKPVELMEELVGLYSGEGQIVIDPFMGSGSTGVACQNLNRRFIGMELDDKHFKTASDRLLSSKIAA